jgi:hypothetical protein
MHLSDLKRLPVTELVELAIENEKMKVCVESTYLKSSSDKKTSSKN